MTVASATTVCAQPAAPEPDIPAHHHVWGHFAPGAWVTTRAVTIDGEGAEATETITERTTTLKSADDVSFTLSIETRRTVAGKVFDPTQLELPPSGYYGENPELEPVVKAIGDERVQVGAKTIQCRVKQIEIKDPKRSQRTIAKVWYAADTSPHILRQSVVTQQLTAAGQVAGEVSRREVRVVMLDKTFPGPDDVRRQGAYVWQTLEHSDGELVIFQLTSDAVPGGVVWQVAREHDVHDQFRGETTLELVDYGLEPVNDESVETETAARGAEAPVESSSKTGPSGRRSLLRRRRPDDSSRVSPTGTWQHPEVWPRYRPRLATVNRAQQTHPHNEPVRRRASPWSELRRFGFPRLPVAEP